LGLAVVSLLVLAVIGALGGLVLARVFGVAVALTRTGRVAGAKTSGTL
jgi:hypothetical protein